MVARVNIVVSQAIVIFFLLAGAVAFANELTNDSGQSCPLFGAEYVPQNQAMENSYDKNINDINRTLSFVLRIEKGDKCCHATMRNMFLYFDAYNEKGEKVSSIRFGDAFSNGVSRQSFSTFWGMYCAFGKDNEDNACKEMNPSAVFYPIGVNEDLSHAKMSVAPPLIIFPETYWELKYNSLQAPEHWDKYIKFYTADRVYPDFRGYDFWVRQKCGEES